MRRIATPARTTLSALAAILLMGAAPVPTPDHYVTQNYGIDLRVPPGLSYCPFPEDAVMSDHGRILTMADAPAACDDDTPAVPAPSIALYYGYDEDFDYSETPACGGDFIQRTPFAGVSARVCRELSGGGRVVLSVSRHYPLGDRTAEVALTLTTTPERLERDKALFFQLASGLSVCRPDWAKGGDAGPCPPGRWW